MKFLDPSRTFLVPFLHEKFSSPNVTRAKVALHKVLKLNLTMADAVRWLLPAIS